MVAVTQILVIDLWSTMDSRIKMDVIEVHGIIEFVLVLTREFFVSQYTYLAYLVSMQLKEFTKLTKL